MPRRNVVLECKSNCHLLGRAPICHKTDRQGPLGASGPVARVPGMQSRRRFARTAATSLGGPPISVWGRPETLLPLRGSTFDINGARCRKELDWAAGSAGVRGTRAAAGSCDACPCGARMETRGSCPLRGRFLLDNMFLCTVNHGPVRPVWRLPWPQSAAHSSTPPAVAETSVMASRCPGSGP